jgi:glyceraldehyde 3-phosphate dehydrogenase
LEYTDEPIVSVDVIGNAHSCVFDAELTMTVGNTVKVLGWYDNEYGYSSRLVDLARKMAGLLQPSVVAERPKVVV